MEITLRKMQHKEDKMQRTASQFQEMEQTVYNSLFTLIKDTSVLRDYAAAALLIINVSLGGLQSSCSTHCALVGSWCANAPPPTPLPVPCRCALWSPHVFGSANCNMLCSLQHLTGHGSLPPTLPLVFCALVLVQECFSAGYASFNLEPVQYSTTAAAGGYAEANKYDPKGMDKYGHETIPAKVW